MFQIKGKYTTADVMIDNLEESCVAQITQMVYSSVKPKDESPLAYKNSKMIEEAIEPTANIIDRLIPVLNLKSGDGEVD